jgi:hypothetical protein
MCTKAEEEPVAIGLPVHLEIMAFENYAAIDNTSYMPAALRSFVNGSCSKIYLRAQFL